MAVLLLWFEFIQVIPISSFMLHGFVPTRVKFGCSLSPLNITSSVQASTVTTLPSMAVHLAFRYDRSMLVSMKAEGSQCDLLEWDASWCLWVCT